MDENVSHVPLKAGRRILVVEDNVTLAYGLKLNLEVEGHDVLIESNGHAALASPNAFQPDLIILDIMLPGLDGFEVLRGWRRSGVSTRVIVLSAKGEPFDRLTGLRLGADDYITKPFYLLNCSSVLHGNLIEWDQRLRKVHATFGSATLESTCRLAW